MATEQNGEGDSIVSSTAADIASRCRAGELSAVDVVEAHIDRIKAVDGRLNAVVVPRFDQARADAATADEARARGDELGPLHGVPVTIKEQFRVAGTPVTLGASAQINNVSRDEGPLVTALRQAGAIVLGKTNITQTLAGWESDNPVYGRTNNPWNLDRTPGGSSGGEAAIIAAGGSALGLGGDFGGSIRVPSHFCGVHGFKPTSHRLSNDDVPAGLLNGGQEVFIPQPGPMARTVGDLQLAMAVLAGPSATVTSDVVPPVPWRDPADVDVDGLRIGMYTDNGFFSAAPSVRRAVEEAADALRARGVSVETIRPPDMAEGTRLFLRAVSAGGSKDLFRLLDGEDAIAPVAGLLRAARIPGPVRPLVVKMMERRGQLQMAKIIGQARACSAADYFQVVEARTAYRAAFHAALDDAGVHAIICPPTALPAFTHGASEHLFHAISDAFVYNVLGTPAGVVSTTRVRSEDRRPGREWSDGERQDMADVTAAAVEEQSEGLPVGVQVVGRHWDDDVVLAVMALLESAVRHSSDYPATPIDPSP